MTWTKKLLVKQIEKLTLKHYATKLVVVEINFTIINNIVRYIIKQELNVLKQNDNYNILDLNNFKIHCWCITQQKSAVLFIVLS